MGNPNPPLDKPYSCDSPVIFSQNLPPSHVERSCESLSVCLQQENPPVKNLQRSPVVVPSSYGPTHMMKSWSQKGEEPSKESTHHHSSLSMDSSHSASSVEVYFSHFRKHRRVMTTPHAPEKSRFKPSPLRICLRMQAASLHHQRQHRLQKRMSRDHYLSPTSLLLSRRHFPCHCEVLFRKMITGRLRLLRCLFCGKEDYRSLLSSRKRVVVCTRVSFAFASPELR